MIIILHCHGLCKQASTHNVIKARLKASETDQIKLIARCLMCEQETEVMVSRLRYDAIVREFLKKEVVT